MSKPYFSIILPTYNRARLLPRAIASVLEQDYRDWELLVVDDGSTDETSALVEDFIQREKRIRFFPRVHEGLVPTRNFAVAESRGSYVAFIDSDDEYKPGHLKLHHDYLLQHPQVQMLYGKVEVIGDPYVPDMQDLSKKIDVRDCVQIGTFFIERDLLSSVGGFPKVEFGEDYALFQKLKSQRVYISESPFMTYRYYRTESDSICSRWFEQS